ncbi:MAG: polysaccharide deacetylase family protein [Rhodospirillaceae bacterium]|jgi:peptidoglycan/xylan/chitin deacetylase (PgdA/CDA1 family)
MPWKQGYTISDEVGLADDQVRWPEGKRCCVNVNVDLSLAKGPDGVKAADLTNSIAVFGMNEGTDLLRATLKRFGIRATVLVPAAMAGILADTIAALSSDGHEIAAAGLKHEDVGKLDRAEEESRIRLATDILADAIGERPMGWFSQPRQNDPFSVGTVSANTIDLLIDAGYAYFGTGLADDIPHYWVSDFEKRRSLLALPYYYHFDDQFFLMFPKNGTGLEHADSLFANWNAEFDAQLKRGRHFNMTLHPYAIGWCNRIKLLEDFLGRLADVPGLWNPTGAELAAYWTETYPEEAHLHLEPSIWADYPGSMS